MNPLFKDKTRMITSGLVFLVFLLLIKWITPLSVAEKGLNWYSVIPPVIAIFSALITRQLILSLFVSVFVGGLLITVPQNPTHLHSWTTGIGKTLQYGWGSLSDTTNLQILVFVTFILVTITVISVSGGLQGIVKKLAVIAKGYISTQFSVVLLGLVLFIDDYANTMLVGSSMRKLTDRYRISREKLAFLVDATSAPVAGLAVISTWIGYEVGLFGSMGESLGLSQDGYSMFFDALSFRFYCLLMIGFVIINAFTGRDFGPMLRAQRRAFKTGKLSEPQSRPLASSTFSVEDITEGAKPLARTALLPLGGLFAYLFVSLWLDGGGADHFKSSIWSIFNPYTWKDIISNASNNIRILAEASLLGWMLALISGTIWGRVCFIKLLKVSLRGLKGCFLPVVILILAWSLKSVCTDLKTGEFLVEIVGQIVSPIWFPATIFVLAGLTAFAIGTSWGTMAILIPITAPIALQIDGGVYGLTMILTLASILDGAILGDHCSPISDTTIMSSISSSCDHIDHVNTQMPYCLLVGLCALTFGYLPAALQIPSYISLLLGLGVLFIILKKWGTSPAKEAPNPSKN